MRALRCNFDVLEETKSQEDPSPSPRNASRHQILPKLLTTEARHTRSNVHSFSSVSAALASGNSQGMLQGLPFHLICFQTEDVSYLTQVIVI